MTNTKKIYTLLIDDNGARILNREYILEEMMYHQDIIDEYIDELNDSTHEINQKLDRLIERVEKKNRNPTLDNDSLIQFWNRGKPILPMIF